MLIAIDLPIPELTVLSEEEVGALENIGTSVFYGRHAITANRDILASLSEHPDLSRRARAAYRSVLDRAMELDALSRAISQKLVLRRDILEPMSNEGEWHVPLRTLGQPVLLNVPEILAENADDARFFSEIGLWYRSHCGLRSLSFCGAACGGGGSTIADELRERVRARDRCLLCIVDSDRDSPDSPLGQTARSCTDELPHELWYVRLVILATRETENLLPLEWLRRTQTGKQSPTILDSLTALVDAGLEVIVRYGDLKNGLSACSCLKSNFVQATLDLRDGAEWPEHLETVDECLSAKTCIDGDAPCVRIDGLGGTLLRQIVAWLTIAKAQETRAVISHEPLREIAKIVFEWGVAFPRIRV